MTGMSTVGLFRKAGRLSPLAGVCAAMVLGAGAATALHPTSAWAQSPSHTVKMRNFAPGAAYPGTTGKVIEGLGLGACLYSVSRVEAATVNSLRNGFRTVTEISPQPYCVTSGVASYKSKLRAIYNYVESHTANAAAYWGGFMLDEEPGFGFSASQLRVLNRYIASLMNAAPGVSWYFTENQPNGWILSTYNSIVGGSWLAPQVYSSSMANAVNAECSTYGRCMNNVTIDGVGSYPWNSPARVAGMINGSAWHVGAWGSTRRFCNVWVPV
jgi:hypothetical protein